MSAKKFVATFICMWVLWLAFTGAPGMSWSNAVQEMIVGAIVAVIVSGISYGFFTRNPGDMVNPKRWAYLLAYIPVYVWYEIKSHLNVAYRILNPASMEPSIVELPTELRSDVGLTTLANSITMTPGTLTVDIDEEEPKLFIHWISAGGKTEPEDAYEHIGWPFERWIKEGLG